LGLYHCGRIETECVQVIELVELGKNLEYDEVISAGLSDFQYAQIKDAR
jgi:hypothetical protein